MFVVGSTPLLQTALHTTISSTQALLLHVWEKDENLSKDISKQDVSRISTFSSHIFLSLTAERGGVRGCAHYLSIRMMFSDRVIFSADVNLKYTPEHILLLAKLNKRNTVLYQPASVNFVCSNVDTPQ